MPRYFGQKDGTVNCGTIAFANVLKWLGYSHWRGHKINRKFVDETLPRWMLMDRYRKYQFGAPMTEIQYRLGQVKNLFSIPQADPSYYLLKFNLELGGAVLLYYDYKVGKGQRTAHIGLISKINKDGTFCTSNLCDTSPVKNISVQKLCGLLRSSKITYAVLLKELNNNGKANKKTG